MSITRMREQTRVMTEKNSIIDLLFRAFVRDATTTDFQILDQELKERRL